MQTMVWKMNLTRLTDNNLNIHEEALSSIPNLREKITNKTLGELEKEGVFVFPEGAKETEDLDNAQMILQKINSNYQTGNIMGFLGLGKERLVISSRFSNDGTENTDFFLHYLLSRVVNLPNLFELFTNTNNENQILDILDFLFPRYLKQAIRKGVFKTYILNEYNDCNIKGAIDIARHIKKNTPFVGNIAYSQREYSYDNNITELIRHTIEVIKRKPYGNQLLGTIKDEVNMIVEATPKFRAHDLRKVLLANKKAIIRHAYFSEYRELQRLCIMILQYEKQEIGFGLNQVCGVLFDGAWLWEEYINLIVNSNGERFYHPKNKAHEGHQWLFTGSTPSGRKSQVGEIYPDFIGKNSNIIADAKYKPMENISRGDYFQVLSYMYRFDAKRGYYFYPEKNENVEYKTLNLNQGIQPFEKVQAREDIIITKLGFTVPQNANNYADFEKAMQKAENNFITALPN